MFFLFFFLLIPRPPRSPLFPYTTLFRSCESPRSPRCRRRRGSPTRDCPRGSGAVAAGSGTRRSSRHDRRRSEEHTSELQSHSDLVCRLLLEKKKNNSLT